MRVGVRQAARALGARRRDRERHLDAVVVVARQRGAGHAPHAVDDERVPDELDVAAHPVELQHGDDAVGLLEADVLDVLEHGPAGREGPERREDRQHVGHRPAVDAHAAQLDAVVAHAHPAGLLVELHRQAHLGEHVEDVRLGMVDLGAERRAHPPEEDVGGMQRAGGEPERRRADVRRQDDLRRLRLLAGLDLEAPPVVGDPDLQAEVPHHPHGQLDVGLLVEDPVDLDDRRPRGEGRQQQQPGDPLRQRPGDPHVPAGGARGLDGDRRPGVLRLQAHPELCERAEQRPDRAALEVLLPGQRHGRVGERREADHEVEGGARAADGHRVAARAVRAAVDDEAGLVLLDPGAEAPQDLDGRADVAGPGGADDAGLPRGERREHERAVRVVLGAGDGYLAPERTSDLADEQVHGAGRLTAREATSRSGDVGSSDG